MKVLTVGTFDLYHPGHTFLFAQARKLAGDGQVIVGVNTDAFVGTFKARPVQTYSERVHVLASVRYIDAILRNEDQCLKAMLTAVSPDILLIGQDWALKNYYAQIGVSQEFLDEHDISLLYVARPSGSMSSTELRGRLNARMDPDALPAAAAAAALPVPRHVRYRPPLPGGGDDTPGPDPAR